MSQLNSVIPKLPSRNLLETKEFYIQKLGFSQVGNTYPDYLMLSRDGIELHFFLYEELDVLQNYAMCYIRVKDIEVLYESVKQIKGLVPNGGRLEIKPWKQKEFSLIDTNHNLLTFGEPV